MHVGGPIRVKNEDLLSEAICPSIIQNLNIFNIFKNKNIKKKTI
jgi:hypothetical protein